MPSPFPGMDPYLEDPSLWPGVHANLIVAIQELLNRTIRPKYVARVEGRVYMVPEGDSEHDVERIPDVKVESVGGGGGAFSPAAVAIAEPVIVHADPIRETRVEISAARGRDVVTVIEVLSPSNKVRGSAGHTSFTAKRDEVMASDANWVEIDLLRDPPRTGRFRRYPYLVHSSPVSLRPANKYWPIRLTEPLPVVGIPLRSPDPDAPLPLREALALAYERAAYDATVDYAADAVPPLTPELAKWAKSILKPKKRRRGK